MGTIVLLDLLGAVALLLWGLHMVRTGILRAFGPDLRRFLILGLRNRALAFGAGLGMTALMQSSTATALMATSFAADGVLALVPALAIMLGANVGTTLIVQVLSFNVSAVAPILILLGVGAFKSIGHSRVRDLGRATIGLGLILIALHMLLDTLAPAEQTPVVRDLLRSVTGDPLLCVVIAALLTWAAHSSVAIVILIMSLAYSQFVTPAVALALVLGANLGSTINPLFEAGTRDNPASKRVPVGNIINRIAGVALFLPFVDPIADTLVKLQPDAAKLTAVFHLAFNVLLALIFMPFLGSLARLLERILPDRTAATDPFAPRYLDESVLDTPSLALSNAARETLRMGDLIETMLKRVMTALMNNDKKLAVEVSHMDDSVDRLDEAIKLYIIKLTRGSLDERDARRAMEIISFAINLEHIGDIIDKNLTELAAKKIKRRQIFSKEGAAELEALHQRVLDSLKNAMGVFMSGDVELARTLIAAKTEIRDAELAAAETHLARLREGRPESLDSSSLHLDILRDLKRIHSHVCSVAYSVLAGEEVVSPPRIATTYGLTAREIRGETP